MDIALSCQHQLERDGFAIVKDLLTVEELEELKLVSERPHVC